MKKIFLGIIALLACVFTAQADDIVSGGTYKILTLDGTKALSCGEQAKNDVLLTMTALSDTEEGQVWTFTKSGDYWNITSALGNFNIDNPSESHASHNNQVLLWQSGNGNNQKWTFEAAADGSYYMVPFENAEKCYALNDAGLFTFQDKGTDTRVKVVKFVAPPVIVDGIESGSYYRICTNDGKSALSNGGSSANDRVLTMDPVDKKEEGQVWQLNRQGNYWQIKSIVGNVCIDNPSANHDGFSNQVIQWKTSGGNNQKWTFEKVGDDFYMVPFESSEKCYGYNDVNNTLVFQDKRDTITTRLKLVKAEIPSFATFKSEGFYAVQAVSTFPTYNYASEGKFLTFNADGSATLSSTYSYEGSRLQIEFDENGVATVTLPQVAKSVVVENNSVLKAIDAQTTADAAASNLVFFTDTDEFTPDTKVAIHTGNTTSAYNTTNLNVLTINDAATGFGVGSRAASQAFYFRLVQLPAGEDVNELKAAIDEANNVLSGLTSDELAAQLREAIATAQSELDYPYVTKKDIALDVKALNDVVSTVNASAALGKDGATTGISENATTDVVVTVVNHTIVVKNAKHYDIYSAEGKLQPKHATLPSGAYVVVADGKNYKVAF